VVYPDPGRPQTTTACTINCKAAINDANSTAAHQTTAPNAAPQRAPVSPPGHPCRKRRIAPNPISCPQTQNQIVPSAGSGLMLGDAGNGRAMLPHPQIATGKPVT
jgi:hypothetical protein